jgi:hypothetical protein
VTNPQNQLGKWRGKWGYLARIAAWILSIIGGLFTPLPAIEPEGSEAWVRLGFFVTASITGFALIAFQRWSVSKHGQLWVIVSATAFGIGLLLAFNYSHSIAAWTKPFNGKRFVIGSTLSEGGKKLLERYPHSPPEVLLGYGTGRPLNIWSSDEIRHRYVILSAMFLMGLLALSIFLISMVQLTDSLIRNPARKQRTSRV